MAIIACLGHFPSSLAASWGIIAPSRVRDRRRGLLQLLAVSGIAFVIRQIESFLVDGRGNGSHQFGFD